MHRVDARQIGGRGHEVVHERASQQLSFGVIGHLLEQRAAHALRHAAVNLTLDDRRIDDLAAVVRDDVPEQPNVAGARIDLHLRNVDGARVGDGRHVVVRAGLEVGRRHARPRERRDRGLDDLAEVDGRAGRPADEDLAVLDLDVVGCGLEQLRRGRDELAAYLSCRIRDRVAGRHAAAAGERAHTERHGGRVAAGDGDPLERHAERVGGDLRKRGLVALPGVHGARGHLHAAGEIELHVRALERTDGRALDVARDADAAPHAARAQRRLLAAEGVVTGGLQGRLQRGGEVAAVVYERVAVAVRHAEVPGQLVGPDVVFPPDVGRIHAEPARQTVDGAIHGEDGLGTAGAAIRRVRRLVRHHTLDVDLHVADAIRADQVRDGVVRQHDAPDVVRAEIEPDAVGEADDGAVAARAKTDRVRLVARVRGGHHVLAPVLDPLHGPVQRARGERDQHVLRIAGRLGAEATAEVGRDHTDLVRRQLESCHQPLLHEVRDLGAVPGSEGAVAAVPQRDDAACLERHADVALDAERLLEHDVGAGQRALGIADTVREADGDVRRPLGMEQRRAGLGRRDHVGDGGQRLPLDVDRLGRVLGARAAVGDDHGHDLADVAGDVFAERPLRGVAHVEAHGGGEAGRGGAEDRQWLQPPRKIGVREDGDHARHAARPRGVDRAHARMGVRRAQEGRVQQTGQGDVVDEAALAAKEARILAPPDGGAEIFRAHQPDGVSASGERAGSSRATARARR